MLKARIPYTLGAMLLAAGVLVACDDDDGTGPEDEFETVQMEDFAFEPATVTVEAGTIVRWENDGSQPHNTTGNGWSSDNLDPDQAFERTFTTPGTFPYVCTLHEGMQGTVVVE